MLKIRCPTDTTGKVSTVESPAVIQAPKPKLKVTVVQDRLLDKKAVDGSRQKGKSSTSLSKVRKPRPKTVLKKEYDIGLTSGQ